MHENIAIASDQCLCLLFYVIKNNCGNLICFLPLVFKPRVLIAFDKSEHKGELILNDLHDYLADAVIAC